MADQSIILYPGDTLIVNVSAGQAHEPDATPAAPPADVSTPATDQPASVPPDAAAAAPVADATGGAVPASPVVFDATGPNVQG